MKTAMQLPVALPNVELLEEDREPLESNRHRAAMNLLLEVLAWLFRGRKDYFAGGNMFIYYSEEQARAPKFRGPDFFYVDGAQYNQDRRYWCVWQEDGKYPDLIIELLSPTTAEVDRTTKKKLYERTFRTHEYFCYDPFTAEFEGWRLSGQGRYRAIKPDKRGWFWVETLNLWLGTWQGNYLDYPSTWLRFFDKDGKLVPIRAEAAEAELTRLRAKLAEREKK